jgi:nucleoside-diphosphate-sugar epimerase
MKVLFIGGTGNISAAVSKYLVSRGVELYHLNRGNRQTIEGVNNIIGDAHDFEACKETLKNYTFDVVVNWIAFTPEDVKRDVALFSGKTSQYIFISSASCYQKPPDHYIIKETTPLDNPYWQYSRDKIACENFLTTMYTEQNFPVTIVRPSHTYNTVLPITLGGWEECTAVDRMKKRLPIIVHGDGTSLWTMTHALDFAVGFEGLLGTKSAIGQIYHITSDEVLTWNQIYTQLAHAVGVEPVIVHVSSQAICDYADEIGYESQVGSLLGDKTYCAVFDNTKIKTLVPAFKTTILFKDGIKDTIKWFEADPDRMVIKDETNRFMDGLVKKFG